MTNQIAEELRGEVATAKEDGNKHLAGVEFEVLERAAAEIDALQQFREWAAPQCQDYAANKLEIERLRAENANYAKVFSAIERLPDESSAPSTEGIHCDADVYSLEGYPPCQVTFKPTQPQSVEQIVNMRICQLEEAIALAYGHLWHVNNEPAAPVRLRSAEECAYEARKVLREFLTPAARGRAIQKAGEMIGRYPSDRPIIETAPASNVHSWGPAELEFLRRALASNPQKDPEGLVASLADTIEAMASVGIRQEAEIANLRTRLQDEPTAPTISVCSAHPVRDPDCPQCNVPDAWVCLDSLKGHAGDPCPRCGTGPCLAIGRPPMRTT